MYKCAIKHDEIMDDNIYLVIESNTGFTISNVNILNIEFDLLKGISKFDYDNKTPVFYNYLFRMSAYINMYGKKQFEALNVF